MILNIDPVKSFIASIASAIAGTSYEYIAQITANVVENPTNRVFQLIAWSVAILAGLISGFNGFLTAREKISKWKNRKKDEDSN